MAIAEWRPPVSPGEPAPNFSLPAVTRDDERVSLSDYRGRSSVFVALFIGLWCPFCRRSIAQTGATEGKLKALGVETLGIVGTTLENARLYFQFRSTPVRLAADPELTTHRAYGLLKLPPAPEGIKAIEKTRINPTGELPEPLSIPDAARALAKLDGYTANQTDEADMKRQWPQLKGQFLIDPNGVVRWANIECATGGFAGFGKFPSPEEILTAARALPR